MRLASAPARCRRAAIARASCWARSIPTSACCIGKACTPRNPIGPCMVSDEGACRIWWASGNQAGGAMNRHQRAIDGQAARRPRGASLSAGGCRASAFAPSSGALRDDHGLTGWVRNGAGQVVIHVEGAPAALAALRGGVDADDAATAGAAAVWSLVAAGLAAGVQPSFRILASDAAGEADIHLPPDLFCCDDCLAEIARSGRAPLPLSLHQLHPMRPALHHHRSAALRPAEHRDGRVRCCAPIAARNMRTRPTAASMPSRWPVRCAGRSSAFTAMVIAMPKARRRSTPRSPNLRDGRIVAVKGVGGYHLMCDPANDAAVARLRERKRRPDKPLAVMFPQTGDDGLDAVRACVTLSEAEAQACVDPVRPIVLARRRADCGLSDGLAPGLAELGVFLPYSPLHHLLLSRIRRPAGGDLGQCQRRAGHHRQWRSRAPPRQGGRCLSASRPADSAAGGRLRRACHRR